MRQEGINKNIQKKKSEDTKRERLREKSKREDMRPDEK